MDNWIVMNEYCSPGVQRWEYTAETVVWHLGAEDDHDDDEDCNIHEVLAR